jgi:hypothetical protein
MPTTESFGGLVLPVPIPGDDEALGDPAIDILAEALPAILRAKLETAWLSVATEREPLFRRVWKHNPERHKFIDADLPALYIYRDTSSRSNLFDAESRLALASTINILWIEPKAPQEKAAVRAPFFQGFAAVLARIVEFGRDPAWVHPDDATDVSSVFWGSDIRGHAGFDQWSLPTREAIVRTTVTVESAANSRNHYSAILGRLDVVESTQFVSGEPFSQHTEIITGGDDPLTVLELLLESADVVGTDDVVAGGIPVVAGGVQVTASS